MNQPSPLRIAVAGFSSTGGSGVMAAELAMAMGRRGHRVFVLSDQPPARLRGGSPNVAFRAVATIDYPLLAQRSYALALAAELVDLARAERLDLLHAHYAIPHALSALLAMQALEQGAPKLVTTLHGTDVTLVGRDRLLQPLVTLAVWASHAVTAPSHWLAEAARAHLGLDPASRIDVIPNFVDGERFRPGDGQHRASRGQVLVHVSNFRKVKRVDDVVRVFAAVRAVLPARLVLVGDGPEHGRCRALAQSLGVATDVDFVGEQADVVPFLRQADVLLLPSESEGFGLAALEAMACGLPVVGSAVGGLPEVVEDGTTGCLAPPGDVAAMAAAVRHLFTDDDLYQRMAAAAHRRAEEHFAMLPVVERYETVYRRVLAR
jgi:L-malate glycosyltransferase